MSLAECTVCRGPKRSDGTRVLDALYRGPAGHTPPDECLECWLYDWTIIVAGENDLEAVLRLLSQGWSVGEIATAMGLHRATIYRWLRPLRRLSAAALRKIAGLRDDSPGHRCFLKPKDVARDFAE